MEVGMNKVVKFAIAATMVGAFALAVSSPSEARYYGRGAALGFGAGALVGAAVATGYYGTGYYGSGYYGRAYGAVPYGYGDTLDNTFLCTMSPASINYVPCDNWGGGK
jgi:hypothetical protein